MNNKKFIVSDYDGTFYLNETDVKKNVEMVHKFRDSGNLFIFATGNNLEGFNVVINKYKMPYDYLILDQGSCIIDKDNNLIKTNYIDEETKKNIYNKIVSERDNIKICSPYSEKADIKDNNITKISTDFFNVDEAIKFTNKINFELEGKIHAYTMIWPERIIVEIISNCTDKCEAIRFVQKLENVKNENVYTVGDGYNDISMIKYFNGYRMRNSVDDLKNQCDRYVSSVSELIEKVINEV